MLFLIGRPATRASLGLLAAAGLALPASAQTYVWRGGGPSDEWRWQQNWNPEGIPGISPAGVDASIPMGGSTVLGWSNVVLNALNVEGSTVLNQPRLSIGTPRFAVNVGSLRDVRIVRTTFVASGPVSLDGEISLLETIFQGAGETALVGGTMNVGRTTWDGIDFRNLATVNQDLGVALMNNATIFNSGRWEMTGISSNGSIGPLGGGRFVNSGQFVYRSSQGPGFGGSIGAPLDSTGEIIVEMGTLQCTGGGTHAGGSWTTRAPGVLRVHGQPNSRVQIEQGVDVSGEGVMRLGPAVTVGGSLNVSGISFIDGDLLLNHGQVSNSGVMTWITGTIVTAGDGELVTHSGSTFAHRQGTLRGRLVVRGTARQEGPLTIDNAADLRIAPGGEWLLVSNDIGRATTPTTGRVWCEGTLRKPMEPGPVPASTISAPLYLVNGGKLRAETSLVNVTGGLDVLGPGHVVVDIGGEVRFSGERVSVGRLQEFGQLFLDGEGTVRIQCTITGAFAGPPSARVSNLIGRFGFGVGLVILENANLAYYFSNAGVVDWRSGIIADTFENEGVCLITGGPHTLAYEFLNEGNVRQTGGPVQMEGGGRIRNEYREEWELVGAVSITNTGAGEFKNEGALIKTGVGTAQVYGRFEVSGFGTVDVRQDTLILRGPLTGVTGNTLDAGRWIVHSGARLVTPGVTISAIGSQADVKISGPLRDRWASLSDLEENGGTLTVSGLGEATTLEGGLDNTGTLVSEEGAELHAPESVLNYLDGEVEQGGPGAEGPVGGFFCPSLVNEGTIRPGRDLAAGPFRLVGDLEMRPTGRVEVELGGPEPYLEHDRADVSGAAALAGTLDLRLLGPYEPEENDTFRVLQAGSVSGQFETVVAPAIGRGLTAVALYDATGVTVRVERGCYADCDPSSGPGTLDIFDFLCFQNAFAGGDPYACDCDTLGGAGVCDVFDFLCFQNAFAGGCP